ncbi:hypothetical protein [Paenibacillus lautus]|uniref:hypothetical protein n=1 Tax=Paenibacillus lautus TaxID=1401 RepID=UPI001C7DEF76|nr:hypothetical protein [Paenibacillus lautus]MBX4152435.1 hypothetical protein [Paenibacillus lautus]
MKETHKAVILRKVVKEVWDSWYDEPHLETKVKKAEVILECELDDPPLVKGDHLFLHEVGKTVLVESVGRSTDNKVVYYTNYIIRTETDETELAESLRKVEEKIEKRKKEREEEKRKLLIEEYNKKSWIVKLFTQKPV